MFKLLIPPAKYGDASLGLVFLTIGIACFVRWNLQARAALRAACRRREAALLRAALKRGAEVGVAAPDDADAVRAQDLLGALRWEAGALDDLRARV